MYALPVPAPRFKNLVCGSGGPTAVLTGSGFIAGLYLCGVALDFVSKGGASAGAIISLMLAAGKSPAEIIAYLLVANFSDLFPRKRDRKTVLADWFLGELRRDETVRIGLRHSEPLGRAMELIAPVWPKGFWTLGSCGEKFYLFTHEGVYEVLPGQIPHLIHKGPAPIATALRITTTIPMYMDPLSFMDRLMQDGCFTVYGRCPTGVVTDLLGGYEHDTISCVPEAPQRFTDRMLIRFAQHLSGKHGELREPTGIVVKPVVEGITSRIQFALSRKVKEGAVLSGARATINTLYVWGRIAPGKHAQLMATCSSFDRLAKAIGLNEEVIAHAHCVNLTDPAASVAPVQPTEHGGTDGDA